MEQASKHLRLIVEAVPLQQAKHIVKQRAPSGYDAACTGGVHLKLQHERGGVGADFGVAALKNLHAASERMERGTPL